MMQKFYNGIVMCLLLVLVWNAVQESEPVQMLTKAISAEMVQASTTGSSAGESGEDEDEDEGEGGGCICAIRGYCICYPQLIKNVYRGSGSGNGTVTVGSGLATERCVVQVFSDNGKAYCANFKNSGSGTTLTIKGAVTTSNGKSKKVAWSYQIIEFYRPMNVAGL